MKLFAVRKLIMKTGSVKIVFHLEFPDVSILDVSMLSMQKRKISFSVFGIVDASAE